MVIVSLPLVKRLHRPARPTIAASGDNMGSLSQLCGDGSTDHCGTTLVTTGVRIMIAAKKEPRKRNITARQGGDPACRRRNLSSVGAPRGRVLKECHLDRHIGQN